ncbi:MAG: TerC family protein [Bacillota bacterium]
MDSTMLWIGFNLFVIGALYFDLVVLNKKSHIIGYKEALFWTITWTVLAFAFNGLIYLMLGAQKGLEFLTGYLIERALSFDNMFVFILIFSYFNVPQLYQPRVLKWGIIGALIMRLIIICVGAELLNSFHWMTYVFGALLLFTGIKMLKHTDTQLEPEKNLLVCGLKKCMPVSKAYCDEKFFTRLNGKICATPLFIVLLLIESADLVFAVDSIPAILAITRDPFIVYSSNVFAIFGLRAMYFLLADLMNMFAYLKYGLSFILVFVGLKMLVSEFYKVPVGFSLGLIVAVLAVSMVVSVYYKKRTPQESQI